MTIRFYSWPRSTGTRVQWALEELGVPYEYVKLDRAKNEHRSPEYLAINPNGKVPALVDGEEHYFESLAILLHLAHRYGMAKGLWPSGAKERAEALSWTVWSTTELLAYMMQYAYHGLDSPVSYKPADRSKATADYNFANFARQLDMLEERLRGREYVMGDFTLVDVPIADVIGFGRVLKVPMEGRPNVAAWLDRCYKRAAHGRIK
jgi:glutathione S-transferase